VTLASIGLYQQTTRNNAESSLDKVIILT